MRERKRERRIERVRAKQKRKEERQRKTLDSSLVEKERNRGTKKDT